MIAALAPKEMIGLFLQFAVDRVHQDCESPTVSFVPASNERRHVSGLRRRHADILPATVVQGVALIWMKPFR